VAVARAINYVMFSLILAALAANSGWETYCQLVLLIETHGANLGDHLQKMLDTILPFVLVTVAWINWKRRPRAQRPEK